VGLQPHLKQVSFIDRKFGWGYKEEEGIKQLNGIDLHCDTILRLMEAGSSASLYHNSFSVDIQKLQQGKAQAQFFAMFVNLQRDGDPFLRALAMIDRFYEELKANDRHIAIARNYSDFLQNKKAGKLSAFLTIEEGGTLKGDLANLRNFWRLGVRLITLTWNYPNEIGYPNALSEGRDKGLTPFGREVIEEMNRLGMLIDVSHLSDRGFYDVAALSKSPFVASHSNARSVAAHPRNLTDDMIKLVADKGGVIGINFEKDFLGNAPISKIEDIICHIRHIYTIGGCEVLAIGSDFDGISPELELAHAGQLGKLVAALEEGGFRPDEIENICWRNALRVIQAVLR
jgi:membrane dipeptidase